MAQYREWLRGLRSVGFRPFVGISQQRDGTILVYTAAQVTLAALRPARGVNGTKGKTMLKQLSLLALAGALGTLARYTLAGWVQRIADGGFPWGTMAVNILGSFLFGIVWMAAENRLVISGQTRFIVLTGFMGAFTTYSTFAFETSAFLRDSQWGLAALNILGQNTLGIIAVLLGFAAGRLV